MEKNTAKGIIVFSIISIILIIFGFILFEYVDMVDGVILQFVRNKLTFEWIKNIMYVISMILSPLPMLVILIIFTLLCNNKITPIIVTLNSAIAGIITFILKNIFRRERPFDYMLIEQDGYSFPSAHSMIGIAFYGTLICCINKYIKSKSLKVVLNVILWFFMICTPISRVYLGVHNLTDILVGVIFGIIIVRTSEYVIKKLKEKEDKNLLKLEAKK